MSEATEKLKTACDEFEASVTQMGGHIELISGFQGQMYRAARALLAERTWMPISEAPRDGSWILGRLPPGEGQWQGSRPVVVRWQDDVTGWGMVGVGMIEIVCWMPIPEPTT